MNSKRTYREFKQGLYRPVNKAKCLNKTSPEYRSGLEMKMMNVLDKNDNILEWSSEKVVIPYFKSSEQRVARYFVDFYFKIKIGELIKEFIVEIKPYKQTLPPTDHGNKKKSTMMYEQVSFLNNTNKWDAARQWCLEQKKNKNRDIEFKIITEKNIDTILTT
jgi:hypothetical protein